MTTVLVFKTSVTDSHQANSVKPVLDRLMGKGDNWNFDLEDCDNILRVEAPNVEATTIITELERAGFICAELDD
jgi:hypothetical protein